MIPHTHTAQIWQLQEAKAKLSEVVQKALEGTPQVITRHGRDEVIVVKREDYDRDTQPKESLVEFFAKSPLRGVKLDLERRKDPSRGFDFE
jgi:prevent-host-death family protein